MLTGQYRFYFEPLNSGSVNVMSTIYDFTARTASGEEVDLGDYRGKVVLIVNTASKCGFTKQFGGLQKLYERYNDDGFVILGFPCNQFAGQEPNDDAGAAQFCQMNYGVSFPMFAKIDVNGKDADPLFVWLKEQKSGVMGGRIKWNFTKFLIGRDGTVRERFAPQTEPRELTDAIEKALAEQA